MFKPEKLKNGLTLFKNPKDASRIVVIGFVVPTGLILEQGIFTPGINYLLERIFYNGTEKYPSRRTLSLAVENLGAQMRTFVSLETFQIYLEVPDYNQYKALSLLADIIQNSRFDRQDIETEKDNLKEQLIQSHKQELHGEEGRQFFINNFYINTVHDYANLISLDALMSIRQEQLVEYFTTQFQATNACLVISGNYNGDDLTKLIDQEWTYWSPKGYNPIPTLAIKQPGDLFLPCIVYKQRGRMYTELHFGFLLDSNPASRFYDAETGERYEGIKYRNALEDYLTDIARSMVLNQILGVGTSSKLWQKTVEEDLLFRHIDSNLVLLENCNYLQIFGIIDHGQFGFGLEALLSNLASLTKNTVSINDLSKAKETIKGRIILEHENLLLKTMWEVNNLLCTGEVFDMNELLQMIHNIQANDIRTLADNLFRQSKIASIILGTNKETKIVERMLDKHLRS